MSLDRNAEGAVSDLHIHTYRWRDLVVYALGIGAKRRELQYLWEGVSSGIRVFPTYAVVPAFPVVVELLRRIGADMEQVVHSAQQVVCHRQAPACGSLETTGRVTGLFDAKRFAKVVITTDSRLAAESIFESEWTLIIRSAGGFGGPRPRPSPAMKIPREREPDWVVSEETTEEQALLYRLSGDVNPLHADDGFAERVGFTRGAILHGLCTYGYVARALLHKAGCEGDRLHSLSASFRAPVWPGDTIVTAGYRIEEGRWLLHSAAERAGVRERETVLIGEARLRT